MNPLTQHLLMQDSDGGNPSQGRNAARRGMGAGLMGGTMAYGGPSGPAGGGGYGSQVSEDHAGRAR